MIIATAIIGSVSLTRDQFNLGKHGQVHKSLSLSYIFCTVLICSYVPMHISLVLKSNPNRFIFIESPLY